MANTESRLLLLPPEIIWDMCSWLIPSFRQEDFRIFQDQKNAAASLRGLISLSQTCRALHAIVLRFRSERCRETSVPAFHLEVIPYVLRLMKDEDLVRRETSFHYNARDDVFGRPQTFDDFSRLLKAVVRLKLDGDCWTNIPERHRRLPDDLEWRSGGANIRTLMDNMLSSSELMSLELVLAHLKNLVHIKISYAHFTGAIGYRRNMATKLPTVRHLELTSRQKSAGSDTSFGLERFTALLTALPNLESLVTFDCCGPGKTVLPNLRHLDLDSPSLAAADLRRLLELCPRLESFRYGSYADHSSLPLRYIVEALYPVKSTLRFLTVHDSWTGPRHSVTLRSLTCLEELSLSQGVLLGALVDGGSGTKLSDILPPFLQSLSLVDYDGSFGAIVMELAEDIRFFKHPLLKRIRVVPRDLPDYVKVGGVISPGHAYSYGLSWAAAGLGDEIIRCRETMAAELKRIFEPLSASVVVEVGVAAQEWKRTMERDAMNSDMEN